ncbi:hypothetical protein LXL04_026366 [Taraxacum kok-saghyz]
MGSVGSEVNMVKCGSGAESPTIQELISHLRTSFLAAEFQNAATTLVEREDQLKKQYNELTIKAASFEKEKDLLLLENQNLNNELKKERMELDALRKENLEYKDQIKVLISENSIPPLVGENGDKKKKPESKFQKIIQIDDGDDDDDDLSFISKKRKYVSNETKTECDSNFVDNIKISTQNRNHLQHSHNQPIVSNPHSTPHSHVDKLKPRNLISSLNTPASIPNPPDINKIDAAYKSLLIAKKTNKSFIPKTKLEKPRWESWDAMIEEFNKDDELCINAICALYRQTPILPIFDKSRITQLAYLVTEGDPQQKLKKTALELDDFDVDDCRRFARKYAVQIYNIYKKNTDPFFPSLKS